MSDDGGYREWQMQQVIDSLTEVAENLRTEVEGLRAVLARVMRYPGIEKYIGSILSGEVHAALRGEAEK